MIRRLINITFMVGALLAMAGCSDEGKELSYTPTVTLTASELKFDALGGTKEVTVNAATAITAKADVDWCRVTDVKGNRITVAVDKNETMESRNARILISDGTDEIYAVVMQDGFHMSYDVTGMSVSVSRKGGSVERKIESISPIKVLVPDSVKSWLTVDKTATGYVFTAKPNEGKPRGTNVSFVSESDTLKYTVMQYDMEELVGNVVMRVSFYWMNQPVGLFERTTITKNEDGTWIFDMSYILRSFGRGGELKMPATYDAKKGVFRIRAGQAFSKIGSYYAVTAILDDSGYYTFSGDVSIDLAPTFTPYGEVALFMKDNGSSQTKLRALGVLFFTSPTEWNGTTLERRLNMQIYVLEFYPEVFFPKED